MSAIQTFSGSYLTNIRTWIVFAFILRLYGIWFPPLEVSHNWRQTTVTMVARNFYETDNNILYPRIDIAGEKSGITGMEFPVLNYLIYLVSLVFGYTHWYGRLINLIVSSIGVLFFHKLVNRYFGPRLALHSGIVLLFSLWFAYSRKIMPDTFSMSLVLAGFYYGCLYLEEQKNKLLHLLAYVMLCTTGILAKLPSAYLLVLFIPFLFDKNIHLSSKIAICACTMVVIAVTGMYYFYWVPYLTETFGFQHFFMGKSMAIGGYELLTHFGETLARFYDSALKFVGFAFFMFGLVWAFRLKNKRLLLVFFLCFAAFLPIVLKAGFTFYHHAYYIIPLVPAMALVCGYGLGFINNRKWLAVVLIAIGLEATLNNLDDFYIKPENKAILNLEHDLDQFSRRSDLITTNSGAFPTTMYFSHRKGWVAFNEELSQAHFVDSLKQKGLKYVVVFKRTFGTDIQIPYKAVLDNQNYRVYKVE